MLALECLNGVCVGGVLTCVCTSTSGACTKVV